jgi:hypothetical protein
MAVTLATAFVQCSCGSSTEPAAAPRARVVVTQRPTMTDHDSVLTALPGFLTVTVYDSAGHPAPRVIVALQVVAETPQPPFPGAEFVLAVRAPSDPLSARVWVSPRFPMRIRADTTGRVTLAVAYGETATTVRMEVRTDLVGLARPDTVSFAIRAGHPVQFRPTPRDTAVYVGRSYQLSTMLLDAHGNVAADPGSRLAIRTDSTATTVSPTGLVTARAIGRSLVHVAVDNVHDSVWTSVVPPGTMAVVRNQPDFALLQIGFDGSVLSVVVPRRVDFPAWSPRGDQLAYSDYSTLDDYGGRIIVRDVATGAEHPLVARYTPYRDYQTNPAFSADGSWIYYAGGASRLPSVVRASFDGSAIDTLAVPPNGPAPYDPGNLYPDSAYVGYGAPVPSPDGRYVAYSGLATCCVGSAMFVQDLTTGTRVKVIDHDLPRWIPGTDRFVAHTPDGFDVFRPDGTRLSGIPYVRIDGLPGIAYDVSPDGHWLVVGRGTAGVELVSLDSGLRLPLAFTAGWSSPAWKP